MDFQPESSPPVMEVAQQGRQIASCRCGHTLVEFDPADASLGVYETRRVWPRGECPACNDIVYASPLHFIAGGWGE